MRGRNYRFCVLLCIAALAACGGRNGVPPATPPVRDVSVPAGISRLNVAERSASFPSSIYTPLPADAGLTSARVPEPFNPSRSFAALAPADLENRATDLGAESRRFAQRFASAPPGDHESEGVFMFGDAPPYNALFGTQTAYEASQRPLTAPAGITGEEQIFVPTMHPAWGSCLENSSFYTASQADTDQAEFTVFNFCESPASFVVAAPIDHRFLQEYVRDLGDGLPSYVSEIVTPDAVPSGTSRWYSLLYNFERRRYEVAATVPAIGFIDRSAFGWSIIEPYAAQGLCPQIAPAMTSDLSVHNTSTGRWDPVTPQLAAGAYSFIGLQAGSTNSCLIGDAGGAASMDFRLVRANSWWAVISPRNVP